MATSANQWPIKSKFLSMTKVLNTSQIINSDTHIWDERGVKLDSFKLRLPLQYVDVIDRDIRGKWILVNEESGVVDSSARTRENSVYRDFPGKVSIRFAIEKQVINKGIEEYLTMSVPAKLLMGNYLDGINSENIEEVHKALIGAKVANFSLYDFLDKSACTDVDFAKDFQYKGDFVQMLRSVAEISKPSKKRDHGYRIFTEKQNQGIEYSVRETTSIASNPYFKIYNKGVELMANSRDFTRDFLYNQSIVGLGRMEATLKNRKHVEMLWGHRCNSLQALLKMPQEDKRQVIDHAMKCHLEKRKKATTAMHQLRGMDVALYQSIKLHLDAVDTKKKTIDTAWDELSEKLVCEYANRSQKSQIRKKLNKFYAIYRGGKESDLVPLLDWS